MPWGAVAAVGGALIGSHMNKKASESASEQQAESERSSIEAQERMFERGLEETAPFREAGIGQLSGYQDLLNSQGRGDFLNNYYSSNEFSALRDQAQADALRGASAQGGLRGGSSYSALSNIAPQLGQNALSSQMQNQMALINIGQGMSGQASQQANALGRNIGQGYQNIGAYQAGNTLNQGRINSELIGNIGGIIGGAYSGGGF